ncbi:hypothetical protein D9756_006839 [Leucocoprinus leucothites]|uniref:Uncharacterized protein n=1 Tax=Leucocoprinus leucothites TaxID=201217 RepID=A0A8H5LH01_9AGAR|nr:hypothetical protein D9756_006839 [Leucoagaricus leucothites]
MFPSVSGSSHYDLLNPGGPPLITPRPTHHWGPAWCLAFLEPHVIPGIRAQPLSPFDLSRLHTPLAESSPLAEVIFPTRIDLQVGSMQSWVADFKTRLKTPVVHICDDDLHLGTLDLTLILPLAQSHGPGILTLADIIYFITHFISNPLALSNFFDGVITPEAKRCVTLAFKRRILGADASDDSECREWQDFMAGILKRPSASGLNSKVPRNCDLFLERRSAWRFSIWEKFSILYVSRENTYSPQLL